MKRNRYSAGFKAKVALEAIRGLRCPTSTIISLQRQLKFPFFCKWQGLTEGARRATGVNACGGLTIFLRLISFHKS